MKTMLSKMLLLSVALASFAGTAQIQATGSESHCIDEYIGGIAFLLEGEVCLSDIDAEDIGAITDTDGKVRDFRFSADFKLLACTRVSGMVEEIGYYEEGEEVPLTETWSIVVLDLNTMTELTEIRPEDGWIHLSQWSAPGKLLYYSSSGYDVSGFFQYDVASNTSSALEYNRGYRMMFADFSPDGNRMLYIDDSGLGDRFRQRLHIADCNTGEDMILVEKSKISDPCFSHNMKSVAFVEGQSTDSHMVAVIWIYDLEYDRFEKLTTLSTKNRGNRELRWSRDDRSLGLFYSPSQRPNGYVFSLEEPSQVHQLAGKQFCWVGNDFIIYARGESDVFIYNMLTREEKLLIENATHPAYVMPSE